MEKKKSIIMVGLAMVISFIITILVMKSIKKDIPPPPQAKLVTQPIAVAAFDLPWGTSLSREQIRMVPFLQKSLPMGSFSDSNSPGKLVGRTTIYPINAGEPILESKLASNDPKNNGVAAIVNIKKRAMAVRVDKVIGVAGFIYPGHRVDILVTLKEKDQEKRTGPITKTVLENILVLAVGTKMAVDTEPGLVSKGLEETGLKEKDKKTVAVDVITLEVTPEEGEKLALAANEGRIQLALRSSNDINAVETAGMTIPVLLSSCTSPSPPPPPKVCTVGRGVKRQKNRSTKNPPKAASKPAPFTVELVKGAQKSEVKFDENDVELDNSEVKRERRI
ncbi:MAG: Flp pilus assembly protein CpaB [bacterium]